MSPQNKAYEVIVASEEPERHDEKLTIQLKISGEQESIELTVELESLNGTLNFTGLGIPHPSPFVACLIAGGLGHLAKEILDCWKSGHRKPLDLWKCLRAKGVSIALALATSALTCLGGSNAGSPGSAPGTP